MSDLPYINIRTDIHLRLGTLLNVIKCLAINKSGRKVLTIPKSTLFYHLSKNPKLTNRLLTFKNRENLNLTNFQINNLEKDNFDFKELFGLGEVKKLLIILSNKGLIIIELGKDGELVYSLSEKGMKVADSLTSEYFSNQEVILEKLNFLVSKSDGQLIRMLQGVPSE